MAILVAPIDLQCYATELVVGDSYGWANPKHPHFYTCWGELHTFNVGDTLLFNFVNETHDVVEVPEYAYGQCYTEHAISLITSGPGVVNLTSSGTRYYISTRDRDCEKHMKLAIIVETSSV
ncbi:blue copper protein-like [Bidens hawaiensis]|uniref:blue copper protein-like n=1 Tax=Bidens hawaiensis TaxID=980011 RepID=UPI004049789E